MTFNIRTRDSKYLWPFKSQVPSLAERIGLEFGKKGIGSPEPHSRPPFSPVELYSSSQNMKLEIFVVKVNI